MRYLMALPLAGCGIQIGGEEWAFCVQTVEGALAWDEMAFVPADWGHHSPDFALEGIDALASGTLTEITSRAPRATDVTGAAWPAEILTVVMGPPRWMEQSFPADPFRCPNRIEVPVTIDLVSEVSFLAAGIGGIYPIRRDDDSPDGYSGGVEVVVEVPVGEVVGTAPPVPAARIDDTHLRGIFTYRSGRWWGTLDWMNPDDPREILAPLGDLTAEGG